MLKSVRRSVGVVAALVAGVAMSLVLAGPAQADKSDCVQYVKEAGYPNTVEVGQACGAAAEDVEAGQVRCARALIRLGITRGEAVSACLLARP